MQKPISTTKILLITWTLCLCGSLAIAIVIWLMKMFVEMELVPFSEGFRALSMVIFTISALAVIPIVIEAKKELGKKYEELFTRSSQFFKRD